MQRKLCPPARPGHPEASVPPPLVWPAARGKMQTPRFFQGGGVNSNMGPPQPKGLPFEDQLRPRTFLPNALAAINCPHCSNLLPLGKQVGPTADEQKKDQGQKYVLAVPTSGSVRGGSRKCHRPCQQLAWCLPEVSRRRIWA